MLLLCNRSENFDAKVSKKTNHHGESLESIHEKAK